MSFVEAEFPQIISLLYILNQKKNDTIFDQEVHAWKGPEYIHEEMNGIRFRIGQNHFTKPTLAQALRLYEITARFCRF